MYQSDCVLVSLCTSPTVYQSHCVPITLCTSLTVYQSHGVPVSLCTSLMVYQSHCVPVSWCTSPTVYQSHGVPVPLCTSSIAQFDSIYVITKDHVNFFTPSALRSLTVPTSSQRTTLISSHPMPSAIRRYLRHHEGFTASPSHPTPRAVNRAVTLNKHLL